MIVPTVIFHVFLIFYQNTAFRILRIPLVSGSDHFVFDRHHLEYLNIIEKMNCLYCGYYNGVAQYAREIGGRTERYWCPIKHSRGISDPHGEYEHFFEYSDAKAYQEGRVALREFKEKE